MGKKGFNWRARQVVKTVVDQSSTQKIKLDLGNETSHSKYDECNALVLPSEKRQTKIKKDKKTPIKILSKKQRKRLEKIVEKKKKKENRASLLEALSSVQATPEELNQLTSIAAIQTKGLKKYWKEESAGETKRKRKYEEPNNEIKINSIAGSKKKRLSLVQNYQNNVDNNDPNVVGFDSSGEDDDVSDDDDDEEEVEEGKENAEEICENTTNAKNNKDEEEDKCDTVSNDEKEQQNEEKNNSIIETMSNSVEKNENKNINKKTEKNENKEPNKDNIKNITKEQVIRKPTVFVSVERSKEIQTARLKLPILAEEQEIMEKINDSSVILLAGETGSGKTTQVPQFLYEAGYAQTRMIAITEPRRVAAIAMSKRVGEEMNKPSDIISYLIRFEGNVTENTKIKFMTDGVLLKEIQNDFLLTKYSVVILDEAHERSVYTDILIGLLSRIVPLRNKKGDPLKLIIMSATLKLEDFTDNVRLFKIKPPVLKVETRQFPVTIHFNKKTNEDYVKEAFNKAVKIHSKLPDGGILIFVTGQLEVIRLVKKLRRAFPLKNRKFEKEIQNTDITEDDDNSEDEHLKNSLKRRKKKHQLNLPVIDLNDYAMPGEDEENEINSDENSDLDSDQEEMFNLPSTSQPLWTLPLYSLLPSHKQSLVFKSPPEGCRLCVVSTNVAETSLTIPSIKYVIDSGRAKIRLYDKVTGVSCYEVSWTSKASADQRAGRAGRTGPGHCYRLYSSAVFNDSFSSFSIPEIQRKPVDDLYLQMKCMNIDKVANFPFPSAPDLLQLRTAEKRLEILGALKENKLTELGKAIAQFPVLPRFGKMLALSHQHDLLPYTVCMVAALSVQEVLIETPVASNMNEAKEVLKKWWMLRRQWAGMNNSLLLGDPMVLLRAVGAAEYANSEGYLERFCEENGLRHKALIEIRKLRFQLTNEIKLNIPECDLIVNPKLKPPTDIQAKLLRQILLAGMGDQVAKKIHHEELKENEDKIKFKYAYRSMDMEDPVFLHSGSVLRKSLPEYVIYQEIYETNKMYMRGVTAIELEWLPVYVPHLCKLCEPLMDPEPRYDSDTGKLYCTVNGTFGRQAWTLPDVEIEFPKCLNLYKWFARFLLDGQIFVKLKKYKSALLSTPSTMIKSWAKLQPRTDIILKALIARQIINKQILIDIWEKEPNYLLPEYQKWLPESAHNEISLMWPPL